MQITYLLFAPYNSQVGEYPLSDFKKVKNSPYFFDIDIEVARLQKEKYLVDGLEVLVDYFLYDKKVVLAQCTYKIENLNEEVILLKEKTNEALKLKILTSVGYNGSLVEEYSVIAVNDIKTPSKYLIDNKYLLARLMRNSDKKLETEEVGEILSSKVSYSKGDLTVVDWEGSLIFAGDGDFESDIELLKVANYQLLRYRMIDIDIENKLKTLRDKVNKNKKSFLPSGNAILKDTIDTQLSLLLDFDKIDQSLLLVGDWYSAKLYRVIVDEFYLDDWKNLVKDRLESLSSIDETVRGNLVFSWERFLDLVSVVGWTILLIGYFWLYFKDAGY